MADSDDMDIFIFDKIMRDFKEKRERKEKEKRDRSSLRNKEKKIKKLRKRDSASEDLPYNIGDPYPSAWGSWHHIRGTSQADGSPVSIFALSGNSAQDEHLAAGRNGVERLRTVRHPNILSFLHSTEVNSPDGSTTIYIVTERVMPLSDAIDVLGLKSTQREEFFALGLRQIAKAVSFLNNGRKLVHGNVCLASVVVTPTFDWKLHAFDVLSEFDGSNESASGPMLPFEWLVGTQYKPMEMVKSDWVAIRKSPPWAIDSWGLGCLIYELFSRYKLGNTEELSYNVGIPKSLLPDYERLLSSIPSSRLNTSKLLENGEYFQNNQVDTIHFMDSLNLKDSVEKKTFFGKLPNVDEQRPRESVLKKTNAGEAGATGGASTMPETAGLIGFAMSSLTPFEQAPLASSSSSTPSLASAASNASSTATEVPSVKASHHTRSNSDFTEPPASPSPTSADVLGDTENVIDKGHDSECHHLKPLDDPKPSPGLSNIQAAQKQPVSQPSRPAAPVKNYSPSDVKPVPKSVHEAKSDSEKLTIQDIEHNLQTASLIPPPIAASRKEDDGDVSGKELSRTESNFENLINSANIDLLKSIYERNERRYQELLNFIAAEFGKTKNALGVLQKKVDDLIEVVDLDPGR